jgi:cyanate lyase
VPKDPLLYRLYEILLVYGYPFKHIIHEKVRFACGLDL